MKISHKVTFLLAALSPIPRASARRESLMLKNLPRKASKLANNKDTLVNHNDGGGSPSRFTREVTTSASYEDMTFATRYYANALDHTSPFSPTRPTYRQRYLLNDTYFDSDDDLRLSRDCPGPIFLYLGGESDVTRYAGSYNGFVKYLTATYGGLLLLFEERYYGESRPTAECCPYLTTQQVLEDAVELLAHVKSEYNAESCPTIAFGGSFAGTLAAFMRSAYPYSVQGALSSSAELGYYDLAGWEERNVTELTFSEIIGREYAKTEGCVEAIWDAADLMDSTDDEVLMETFNLCDESALQPRKSSLFTYDLEGLVQENYPYPVGPYPAWPVEYSCQIMVNEKIPLLERAAEVVFLIEGASAKGPCIPAPDEGPGNIPGDGPGPGSWGYQSCTETLHGFGSVGRGGLGVRNFSYEERIGSLTDTCVELFGVVPDQNVLTMRYGGFDIAKTTSNTIFSMGKIDPWGGAAILATDGGDDAEERGVHFFELEKAAHHLDLRGWNDADPPEVTNARREEERIIMGWVMNSVNSEIKKQDKGGAGSISVSMADVDGSYYFFIKQRQWHETFCPYLLTLIGIGFSISAVHYVFACNIPKK